jgi:hypothetical protein
MDDYICITVLAQLGEAEGDFSARLSRLWTHMLRDRKQDFEKVYAETTEFDDHGGRLSRQYLAQIDVLDLLETEMNSAGIDFEPVARDEVYSKYEATPPEWMQIEH